MSLTHGQDQQLGEAALQLAEKAGYIWLAVCRKRCAVLFQGDGGPQCLSAVLIQAALKALQLQFHAPGPQIGLVSLQVGREKLRQKRRARKLSRS